MTSLSRRWRRRRWARLAMWIEALWWCRCDYRNIATYRCIGCGSRPPRRVRAQMEAAPPPAAS